MALARDSTSRVRRVPGSVGTPRKIASGPGRRSSNRLGAGGLAETSARSRPGSSDFGLVVRSRTGHFRRSLAAACPISKRAAFAPVRGVAGRRRKTTTQTGPRALCRAQRLRARWANSRAFMGAYIHENRGPRAVGRRPASCHSRFPPVRRSGFRQYGEHRLGRLGPPRDLGPRGGFRRSSPERAPISGSALATGWALPANKQVLARVSVQPAGRLSLRRASSLYFGPTPISPRSSRRRAGLGPRGARGGSSRFHHRPRHPRGKSTRWKPAAWRRNIWSMSPA